MKDASQENYFAKMEKFMTKALHPETELERALIEDQAFMQGLNWGIPRYGHPEGEVYKHINEVLENIDCLEISKEVRTKLRLIAFVHDTFKYKEDKSLPRDWSKHHAVFARKFAQRYITDQQILDIIETHDEAYHCWQLKFIYKKTTASDAKLTQLLEKLGNGIQLYYLFFKCDTLTGDKNPAPLKWFENTIPAIKIIPLIKK